MTGTLLAGKVALITGAASGLGAATARLFADHGAKIVIADVLEDEGKVLAAEIGSAALYVNCDVLHEENTREGIGQAVARFGRLDVVFANAGGGGAGDVIADMSAEEWDRAMALMPRAAMFAIKHAAPQMRRTGGGSIIATASIAGMRAGISGAAYSVAKAAVIQLAQMAAVEFGPDSIRVNTISPGIIPTPGVGGFFGVARDKVDGMLPGVSEIFNDAQPIPRSGRCEDIAQIALYLASDAASWVSGQNFVVDGAMTAMGPGSLEAARPGGVIQRTAAFVQQFQN